MISIAPVQKDLRTPRKGGNTNSSCESGGIPPNRLSPDWTAVGFRILFLTILDLARPCRNMRSAYPNDIAGPAWQWRRMASRSASCTIMIREILTPPPVIASSKCLNRFECGGHYSLLESHPTHGPSSNALGHELSGCLLSVSVAYQACGVCRAIWPRLKGIVAETRIELRSHWLSGSACSSAWSLR